MPVSRLNNRLKSPARLALLVLSLWLGNRGSATAQRLEAVGVAASFNINQTWARQKSISAAEFTIRTDTEGSRLDDTGNRFSAYARVGVGAGRFFVQPELAYTSVLGQANSIFFASQPGSPFLNQYIIAPRLRRFELATLAGLRLGQKGYLLAGPVFAVNQREQSADTRSRIEALAQGINNGVERVQLAAQVGVGIKVWRLDLNARYEHSLTPYTKGFVFDSQRYDYRQATSQLIFSLGYLLYDSRRL
jgi:hypothetical protein